MAEKYYGVNTYSYCAGNPIINSDPNGSDVWEVNQSGEIINSIKDKTQDTFILIDEKGNQISSVSFNYGTVIKAINNDRIKGYVFKISSFLLSNVEDGATLFKFFADNTKTEFGLITMRNETSLVMTNHKTNSIPVGLKAKELVQKWATRVNLIIHNHPLDTDPSGFKNSKNTGDRKSANYVKHAIFYVYKPGKGVLMQYDAKQLYVEEKKWETVFPYK